MHSTSYDVHFKETVHVIVRQFPQSTKRPADLLRHPNKNDLRVVLPRNGENDGRDRSNSRQGGDFGPCGSFFGCIDRHLQRVADTKNVTLRRSFLCLDGNGMFRLGKSSRRCYSASNRRHESRHENLCITCIRRISWGWYFWRTFPRAGLFRCVAVHAHHALCSIRRIECQTIQNQKIESAHCGGNA